MDRCPICGYKENNNVKAMSNVMSRYVLKADPKRVITMNSAEEKLELGEARVAYIREDVYLKSIAPKIEATPPAQGLVPSKTATPLVTPPAK